MAESLRENTVSNMGKVVKNHRHPFVILSGVDGKKIGIWFVISVIVVLSSIIWKFAVQNDLNWLNSKRQFVDQQN
ncbi:MAG: hypothetical protein ACI8RD_008785 [Bacillariaceae sp.]|jgi:hypothetical protein